MIADRYRLVEKVMIRDDAASPPAARITTLGERWRRVISLAVGTTGPKCA